MYLIVGLGNPGAKYTHTYHNLGYMCIDALADKLNVNFNKKMFDADVAQVNYNGQTLLLIKPLTYMNLSGESVIKFVTKYKIKPEQIIVFCDDIDLKPGVLRFKEHGSGGTHNGLKNIVYHIGEGFKRIKIGCGQDKSMELADYVLSNIDDNNWELIKPCVLLAGDKALQIICQK